jgi:hypothetical protein
MAAEDKQRINQVAIEELRRRYDKCCADSKAFRTRVLAVVVIAFGLVTFLYSSDNPLVTPSDITERIFYYAGLGLIALAFGILFKLASSIMWSEPVELKELKRLHVRYRNFDSFNLYVIEDYIDAIEDCGAKQNKRIDYFDLVIKALFIGGIILLVIKFTN